MEVTRIVSIEITKIFETDKHEGFTAEQIESLKNTLMAFCKADDVHIKIQDFIKD